tara:strand:- start:134 stop:379 length:246 start_codon:yes stop_codon:yes gene_type:complete
VAKKVIKVNPNAIKGNKVAKPDNLRAVISVEVEGIKGRFQCFEVDIDGSSSLVYVKSNGVWLETESRIVCRLENGEEKVFD